MLGRRTRTGGFLFCADCAARAAASDRLAGSIALSLLSFFQAEDGIRDLTVTGVQTCALPIFRNWCMAVDDHCLAPIFGGPVVANRQPELVCLARRFAVQTEFANSRGAATVHFLEIGRASCRERV